MARATWTTDEDLAALTRPRSNNRILFLIVGAVMLAAVVFLVINAISGNTQLYKTVDEFYAEQARLTGRDLRVAGWVVDDTVQYTQIDATTSRLEFDIVDNLQNPAGGCMWWR